MCLGLRLSLDLSSPQLRCCSRNPQGPAPGSPESHLGRLESHPGCLESHPGRLESHLGSPGSHWGALDHTGEPRSHPGSPESHPSHTRGLTRVVPTRLRARLPEANTAVGSSIFCLHNLCLHICFNKSSKESLSVRHKMLKFSLSNTTFSILLQVGTYVSQGPLGGSSR